MKKIILVLATFLVSLSVYGLYTPTDRDYDVVDRVENRIYDAIDQWKLTPAKVISKLDEILERNLTQRISTLIKLIRDDIEYSYYGSYADEWFEMSPDECFDDEYFDEQSSLCLPESYYDEYDDYENEDYSDQYADEDFSDSRNEDSFEQTSNNSEAVYNIDADTISLLEWEKLSEHTEIWELFAKIIPTYYRADFKLYSVYDDEDDSTVAVVYQNDDDITLWNLDVNRALFYDESGNLDPKESIHTLIHEFSHVLTLSKTQVEYITQDDDVDDFQANCRSTFISEWCLKNTAFLELFIKKFWSPEDVEATEVNQEDIYPGNEDKFVTDYAATNPAEDIAETFTYFVLKPKPTGNTIADKKIQFFYEFENLVNLRKVIRNRIK